MALTMVATTRLKGMPFSTLSTDFAKKRRSGSTYTSSEGARPSCCWISSTMGVRIIPGATAMTLMPRGANSIRMAVVSASRPNLLAE